MNAAMNAPAQKPAPNADAQTAPPAIRGYYDRANPDLLQRIPLTAKKVLELGCGAGALGTALKRRNPDVFYAGLELDDEAAAIARERLDHVTVFNADTDDIPKDVIENGPYDAVVFGDVLEHLRDPWAVTEAFAELLRPGGTMLACIPNVQNWRILQTLMTEGFKFEDEGLFDRTHLRWFALPNMVELFQKAGIVPVEGVPRHFIMQTPDGKSHDAFVKAMTPSLPALGMSVEQFARKTKPLQYVITGTKGEAPQRMLVQGLMLKPVGGVNDVRMALPLETLRSVTGVETIAAVRTMAMQDRPAEVPKIVVWQRPIQTQNEAAKIMQIIERGYVVVIEFDDHTMRWPAIEENDYLTLKGCHGVQTSTNYLADVFRDLMGDQQRDIAVFRNTVLEIDEPVNFQNPNQLRVFFGALNREEDWAPIMDGLNKAIASLDDPSQLFFDVIHDVAFVEALETEHKAFTPTCDYPTYRQHLAAADVALLPLADTLFNNCKSDLKFIEAGAAGCAVLASSTLYERTMEDGKTGRLIKDPADFGPALLDLLKDRDQAKAMGRAAHDYVRGERLMCQQVQARLDWYQKLWDERDTTTPKLIAYLEDFIRRQDNII